MPVQILTVRLRNAAGHVEAVRHAPFIVCGDDEDIDELLEDLRKVLADLERVFWRRSS